MNDLVKQLQKVERSLSAEKGMFNLFALFLRENAPGTWDLLLAAPWVERNKGAALRRVAKELRQTLTKKQLLQLSRMVIIHLDNPGLAAFQRAFHVEHSDMEFKDSTFFGLDIKHAHVITSKRKQAA